MAYDQHLAERVEQVLKALKVPFENKKMMGGLCVMMNDKMTVGVIKDSLMIRIDPDLYETSLKKNGCRPMDFTGKVMKGFLIVDPIGIDQQEDLEYWVKLCVDFNPRAKSSKRPKTKSEKSAKKNRKKKSLK